MSTLTIPSAEMYRWPLGFGETLPSQHWQVLHSLPRQDKQLIADLKRRSIAGVAFYENRVRRYLKSTQSFQVPLLGGYVFAYIPRERRHDVYETGRIVRIIDVTDPLRLTHDLEALGKLLEAVGERRVSVRPEIVVGKIVMITSGMFAGCTGIVQRRKANTELVVNLPVLGQSVATNIPLEMAELATELEPGLKAS